MAALDFPDNPATGDLYGSSGTVWRWDGARWASTAGASGARGTVAFAESAVSVAGIAGGAWVQTGVSVTFNATLGRRYKVSYTGTLDSNHGAAALAYLGVYDGNTNSQLHVTGGDLEANPAVGDTRYWNGSFSKANFSGTTILRLQCYFAGGTNNQFTAIPAIPAQLLVEDITYEAGTSGTPGTGAGRLVAYANTTTSTGMTIGATAVQISGFSVNFNAVAGNWYQVEAQYQISKDATVGDAQMDIRIGTATSLRAQSESIVGGHNRTCHINHVFQTVAAGSTSLIGYISCNAGALTVRPGSAIIVTDLGQP